MGLNGANSPNIKAFNFGGGDTAKPELRYPCGYLNDPYPKHDSAFIGIAMRAQRPSAGIAFTDSKEYPQSKLYMDLPGSSVWRVSYYVSRSKYSSSIKKICALFTSYSPINPSFSQFATKIYENNLASNNSLPYDFLDKPQICSDVQLTQKADAYGYGGWQKIVDTLYVPHDSTYRYITLGNFQNDSALWNDITMEDGSIGNKYLDNEIGLYYFIDSVSLTNITFSNCVCIADLAELKVEKQNPSSDSTKCCYDFSLMIPSLNYVTVPYCEISRFRIYKGTTKLYENTAAAGTLLNGNTINGTFCVDKFPTSDNVFTVRFYKKDHLHYDSIEYCDKTFKLNCQCDCSDIDNNSFLRNKIKFDLVKVDSSASGRCCWDVVMENPASRDSSSCEYNLSNKFALLTTDTPPAFYQIFSSDFTSTPNGWIVPANFIIKPGDKVTIGKICTMGYLTAPNNQIKFTLTLANSPQDSIKCSTILSKTISCDTIINPNSPDSSCCDNWEIKMDNIHHYSDQNHTPPQWTYCGGSIHLYYNNTTQFCDANDTYDIELSINGSPMECFRIVLNNITHNALNISPMMYLSDTILACVTIVNIRTLDTCIKCVKITCTGTGTGTGGVINPNGMVKKDNDEFQKSSQYYIEHPDEFFDVVPNPIENKFDIIFRSDNIESCSATLNDNLGNLIMTNNFTSQTGVNKISFNNVNASSGLYFINLNIAGKLYTKKILILK